MTEWRGLFWLPSNSVDEANRVEGILRHSDEGTHLELLSKRLAGDLPGTKEAWRHRVVGMLAGELFVRMDGCRHLRTTNYAMRRTARLAFSVNGDVFVGSDQEIVSPAEIQAQEDHVEIEGLPEWFASALSHPHSSIPYLTGIPLKRSTRVDAQVEGDSLRVDLDDGFELRAHNTLYWGSDGLFDLSVRQATVATIRAPGLVRAGILLHMVRPLVDLLRFVSGENCRVRSAYLYRTDRSLPDRLGGGPVGVRLLTGGVGHNFTGWGDMLFRWRDIAGCEDALISNWYRLHSRKKYALRVLDRVVSHGESAEAGIVLMVGAIQALTPHRGTKRYENFLRSLELEGWGLDVAAIGQRISDFRNAPAHGRALPKDEDVLSTYRFVVASMRIYFLRGMGFTCEQVLRIARRHREVREGLGLREEGLDVQAQNKMLQPGWIMTGR